MNHPSTLSTRRVFLGELTTAGAAFALLPKLVGASSTSDFRSDWQTTHDRPWPGPDYWSNPLQDWRLSAGRLECTQAGPARNVQHLTRALDAGVGSMRMTVRLGLLGDRPLSDGKGAAGFSLGVKSALKDFRHALIYGVGVEAGLRTSGELFIDRGARGVLQTVDLSGLKSVELKLELDVPATGSGSRIKLSATDPASGRLVGEVTQTRPAKEILEGNLALCANYGVMPGYALGSGGVPPNRLREDEGADRWWFEDWQISGSKVAAHPDRAFGPLCFNHYTLHARTLKMSVQLAPVGVDDEQRVRLELSLEGRWRFAGESRIDPTARIAEFRVQAWDPSEDVPYRVVYQTRNKAGAKAEYVLTGVIRHDPVEKDELSVADISCNAHFAFPNTACVASVAKLDPDLLAFTGDQYYEASGGFAVDRSGGESSLLDVLRKWMLHGWTWRELLKDRPAVSLPDDHDVYHGNLWGAGGVKAPGLEAAAEAKGGYKMTADFVNAVYRMQTSHHPDSPARPGAQGIIGYYGPLTYGRVSFAILADRQYKSGPSGVVPPTTSGRDDHVVDPSFDPKTADLANLELLGKDQTQFLKSWADDWNGADMKSVISQTVFTAMATHHGRNFQRLIADYDTNAWPQTARNEAVKEMRQVFAFHIAGDQHLPAVIHYGVDGARDSTIAFASPAVNNVYPRKFEPEGATVFTGDFRDAFGHPMGILAYANAKPEFRTGVLEAEVDKACGFGIVRFNTAKRTITIDCWPLLADPDQAGSQFPGWPVVIPQLANYGRKVQAHLPELRWASEGLPVVSVFDDKTGEKLYTLRVPVARWKPPVFAAGTYSLHVTFPESGKRREFKAIAASAEMKGHLDIQV